MSADDARRWDERWHGHDPPVAERPVALTGDVAELLARSGRALDVACGAGAQTLWLAQRGLDVVALDASAVAADLVRAAVVAAGLDGAVTVRVVDLDHGIDVDLGDFDVIVCQRFRAVELYQALVDRLRPSGIAIVTVLSRTGASEPGPFHATPGELAAAFDRDDCDVLHHAEADGEESIVVRRHVVARRRGVAR